MGLEGFPWLFDASNLYHILSHVSICSTAKIYSSSCGADFRYSSGYNQYMRDAINFQEKGMP
jgi:hypothetical protein